MGRKLRTFDVVYYGMFSRRIALPSDPVVLEQAIAYTRNILENDPKVSIISISQNDNLKFCTCPRCAAVDEEEGSHMGTILRFVNAVAENIKDDYYFGASF